MKIAAGISINYQIDGRESAPWLIFSNSLLTDLTMWDDQVAALKDSFRILRYDQRGHGGTQVTEGKYTFDLLAADVIGLMDELFGVEHFVGISMGGMTALLLAEKYRDRFNSIIPCDCGPASTPAGAQQWQERIELANAKGMAGRHDVTIPRWFPPEFVATKSPVLDKVRGMIEATPLQGFAGCGGAVGLRPAAGAAGHRQSHVADRRHQGRHGRRDQGDQSSRARIEVELEGAGHLSNLEQPQKFSQSIREFIKAA